MKAAFILGSPNTRLTSRANTLSRTLALFLPMPLVPAPIPLTQENKTRSTTSFLSRLLTLLPRFAESRCGSPSSVSPPRDPRISPLHLRTPDFPPNLRVPPCDRSPMGKWINWNKIASPIPITGGGNPMWGGEIKETKLEVALRGMKFKWTSREMGRICHFPAPMPGYIMT